jgi:ABC-2 type transport system permease protein
MLLMVGAASLALIGLMFLLMARVSDPLIPRALCGMLSTVLCCPSGVVYP